MQSNASKYSCPKGQGKKISRAPVKKTGLNIGINVDRIKFSQNSKKTVHTKIRNRLQPPVKNSKKMPIKCKSKLTSH
jgi:hypothetical protein